MTQRFTYPDGVWASGGVATDPDTDTTHPSYVANRYATIGWKAEKPPNEWDNYLYQITDAKIIWLLQEGIPTYDSGVRYNIGSLTRVGEIVYKNISGLAIVNTPPATSPTSWQKVLELDGATFTALLAALTKKLTDHLAADNPHNDTIEKLGGVQKEYTFKALDDDTDPQTIKYHTKQRGKVHSETPKQLGTLPAATTTTENTFTGDVVFSRIYFDAAKKAYTQLNQATARAEIGLSGTSVLAVDVGGRVYYRTGNVDYLVVTIANFDDIQIQVNNLFALPQPMGMVDVSSGSLSFIGINPVVLTTTSEPVFDAVKGITLAGSGLNANLALNFTNVPTTAYIVGYNAKGLQTEFYNSVQSEYSGLEAFLTNRTVSKFTHLKSITIYPTLSAYQKSTLVKYVTA